MDFNNLKNAYAIIREIGRGSMGSVFQAWDKRLERNVALKILSLSQDENQTSEAFVGLFLQEAKAVARLNHPHIVTLYDIGGAQGRYFMVMEYVEGYNLEVMLKQLRRVAAEMVIDIGLQLCDALDSAHRQGIVHRDIKPANVLLNGEGRIKLMDFGIAQIQRDKSVSAQGELVGSVLYMAPEQLVDASKADQRADLYAVGVTLYELLSGTRPFHSQDIPRLITEIMTRAPGAFAGLGVAVPAGLEAIVFKALEKNPQARYQTAAEMRQALLECKLGGTQTSTASDASPDLETLRSQIRTLLAQVRRAS